MTTAQINDIQINNEWTDPYGSKYYMNRLDGWDSPPIRSGTISLPSQHGEVTVEALYNARLISIGGICKATSANNFHLSMYYLMAQLNAMNNTVTLKVTEEITRRAEVRRSGPVRTAYVGVGTFTWEVSLRSDDPTKFAEIPKTEALSGGVAETLTNDGTIRTYPVVTTLASGTPIITVGTYTWTAIDTLPSGTVIDMKKQTAVEGSTSYFDKVQLTSDWLWLEAGDNTVESSVACTFDWRDAWV